MNERPTPWTNAGIGPSAALFGLLSLIQILCRACRKSNAVARNCTSPPFYPVSEASSLRFARHAKTFSLLSTSDIRYPSIRGCHGTRDLAHTITSPLSAESETPARRPGPRLNLSADPSMHVCRLQRYIQTVTVTQSIIWGTFPRSQPAEPERYMGSSFTSGSRLTFVQTFAGNTVITRCFIGMLDVSH
ncbi:hypothetical protein BDW68DRAFT_109083 [Aspergillus falconensis]